MGNTEKNTDNTEKRLANLKLFQPGVSGNPAGRPKGSKNKATILRDVLKDKGVEVESPDVYYMSQYIDIIQQKDQSTESKMRALENLWNRTYGKPKSTVEHGRTPEELKALGDDLTQQFILASRNLDTEELIEAEEAEVVD